MASSVGRLVGVTLAVFLGAACGSSNPSTEPPYDLADSATVEGGTVAEGGGSGSSSGGGEDDAEADASEKGDEKADHGKVCASSCTTDAQCESTCAPVMGGGTNCCDTGSGICYSTSSSTCPTPQDAGKE